MKPTTRVWLCFPALLLFCCDVTITLGSQHAVFWAGSYEAVEEGNPLARLLLLLGPWPFVAAAICWALAFSVLMLRGPRSWAVVVSFVLTFSHALGTACWLLRHGVFGMLAAVAVLFAAERILAWSWNKSQQIATNDTGG